MTNNTDKPMEWEKAFDEDFVIFGETNDESGHYETANLVDTNPARIKQFIREAIQATREETLEEIQKWNFNNGITHKESFAALRNYLDSLTNKSESK